MEHLLANTGLIAILTAICIKSGITKELIIVLIISMILDYASGMIAAGITGQLNSRKGIFGILKKISYIVLFAVTILMDYLIFNIGEKIGYEVKITCTFSLLFIIWLILNELISIIENVARMGVELPMFIKKLLKLLKNKTIELTDFDNKNQNS